MEFMMMLESNQDFVIKVDIRLIRGHSIYGLSVCPNTFIATGNIWLRIVPQFTAGARRVTILFNE